MARNMQDEMHAGSISVSMGPQILGPLFWNPFVPRREDSCIGVPACLGEGRVASREASCLLLSLGSRGLSRLTPIALGDKPKPCK